MTPEEEAELLAYLATLHFLDRRELAEQAAITERHLHEMRHGSKREPANYEVRLERQIMAQMADAEWYHGGAQGLSVIVPASVTGADPRFNRHDVPDRADWVHLTSDRDMALDFAAYHPNGGKVYRVKPVGPVSILPAHLRWASLMVRGTPQFDPLALPMTFCCGRAEVIE
jgi:hypothetical protein